MIAIQLNALLVDDAIVLHFTKVLDVYQEAEVEDEVAGGQVYRRYWDKRASAGSLAVLDKILSLVQGSISPPRVTYNKNHIALGTTGVNFCWFHPPKEAGHCHLRVRARAESRDEIIKKFSETGLYVRPFQTELITFKLAAADVDRYRPLIEETLRICEAQSRDSDGAA